MRISVDALEAFDTTSVAPPSLGPGSTDQVPAPGTSTPSAQRSLALTQSLGGYPGEMVALHLDPRHPARLSARPAH